ncbi:TetR/AcrR family transcriptional regulator [Aliamphritea spongicola]|uniref:TetR/AcrR family transcriptional regulator n=1 Tax=Aliamphritea spongicola TaxID=707589 RepID=UPI00196B51ED|nr:TetR/AcrR family transcriptional regulator [Aliamphritea spongicola]MBN3564867.1 TetR/AcrR family transcriptional regulator [Aliamphritea spongicola]
MARGRPSKKQQLLDTARRVFAENGYQGTSIDLIVQEAGVSKPTVYNNFPTKQALLIALLEQLTAELEMTGSELLTSDLDTSEAVIRVYLNIATQPEYLMIYRILCGEHYKLDELTRNQVLSFDQGLHQRCLEALQSGGITRPEWILMFCRDQIISQALKALPDAELPGAGELLVRLEGLLSEG